MQQLIRVEIPPRHQRGNSANNIGMDALYDVLDEDLRGLIIKYLDETPHSPDGDRRHPDAPSHTHLPMGERSMGGGSVFETPPPPAGAVVTLSHSDAAGSGGGGGPPTDAVRVQYHLPLLTPPSPSARWGGVAPPLDFDIDDITNDGYGAAKTVMQSRESPFVSQRNVVIAAARDADCCDDGDGDNVATNLALVVEARIHFREATVARCLRRWRGRLEVKRDQLGHKEWLAGAYHAHCLLRLYIRAWGWRLDARRSARRSLDVAHLADRRRLLRKPFRAWKQHTLYLRKPQRECLTTIKQTANGFLAYDSVRRWVGFWHRRSHSKELEEMSRRALGIRYLRAWRRYRTLSKTRALTVLALVSKCGTALVSSSATNAEDLHRREHHGRVRKGRLPDYEERRLPYLGARYFIAWLAYSRLRTLRRLHARQHAVAMLSYRSFLNLTSVAVVRWFLFVVARRNQRSAAQLQIKTTTLHLADTFLRWVSVVTLGAVAQSHYRGLRERGRRRVLRLWKARADAKQRARWAEAAAASFRRHWDRLGYVARPFRAWRLQGQHAKMVKEHTARSLATRKLLQQRYAISILSRFAGSTINHDTAAPSRDSLGEAVTRLRDSEGGKHHHHAPILSLRAPAAMLHYDPHGALVSRVSGGGGAVRDGETPFPFPSKTFAPQELYALLTPRVVELRRLQESAESTQATLSASLAALSLSEASHPPTESDSTTTALLRHRIDECRRRQDRMRVLRTEVASIRAIVATTIQQNQRIEDGDVHINTNQRMRRGE